MTRKLRVWWLATSRAASGFEWSWTTNPAEFAGGKAGAGVIGPFLRSRRHGTRRFWMALGAGTGGAQGAGRKACVYKQMGKCPAACDGSESIGRTSEAGACAGTGERRRRRCRGSMRLAAVGRQAFEEAASIRGQRDELAAEAEGVAGGGGLGRSLWWLATSGEGRSERAGCRSGPVGGRGRLRRGRGLGRIGSRKWRGRLDAMSAVDDLGDLGVLGVVSGRRCGRRGADGGGAGEVDGESLLHAAGGC